VCEAVATEVVCHRGANRQAPENTYASTQVCIDWGVEYVEIDVRRSRDGVMYVIHDAKVDRTTDGTGFVNELDSEEIDGLDAGSWFGPEYAGERVPRLEPFLEWVRGRIGVYFDVKDADVGELVALARRLGFEEDSFFWFSDEAKAREFRRVAPDLRLKVNAVTEADARRAAEELRADIIEVRLRHLTPELERACRDLGMELMVYEPLADREAFARIIEWGADKVNLNDADVFLDVQRELAERAEPATAAR
jgi:glycerophosphoryl diester phosphodiesterase